MDCEFDGGAVQLISRNGRYIVIANGEDDSSNWSESQLKNPTLAVQRFVMAVNIHLKSRVKKYLAVNGCNTITGCQNSGVKCPECRASGANLKISDCIFK